MLELTHVEPVDQWSGKGKADGVSHFWERAGQRHAALKRVAQPPECRFLFTAHMQHVMNSPTRGGRIAEITRQQLLRIEAEATLSWTDPSPAPGAGSASGSPLQAAAAPRA